jgi:hypothetical protein
MAALRVLSLLRGRSRVVLRECQGASRSQYEKASERECTEFVSHVLFLRVAKEPFISSQTMT